MEISSRTIISWFFHLHGNVRANASNISCASSVTFSPMLSVCIVIITEREREREVSVDTKRPARENGTSQKGWTFQIPGETILSNNLFHSGTMQDAHSSKITRRGTHGTRDDDDQMKSNPKKRELHSYLRQTAPLSPRFQTVAPAFLYR